MSRVYDISNNFVEASAALDPIAATARGVTGHDEAMTDYSPAGEEARAELARRTLTQLRSAAVEGERDRLAVACLEESLQASFSHFEAGEHLRSLRVLGSPVQSIRRVFDLMPKSSAEDWRTIARRLALVPRTLEGFRASLEDGLRAGKAAAPRQARACAAQALTWSGKKDGRSYFARLVEEFEAKNLDAPGLVADLATAASAAGAAYEELASYLGEYASRTRAPDAVGMERYALWSRLATGANLDLAETYAWGWSEFRWVEQAMRATAGRIKPGASIEEATGALETDRARTIEGEEAFRGWMQELQDRTIAELDGRHFDVPAPVRRIEAMIAPPGGALAMYYTPPAEDFSRPGRTWYPTGGRTTFPLWREVSIAYHEGVPGHHFQIGTTRFLSNRLSRYQRIASFSGYSEGWALYAERLMGELGYLQDPAHYMGMLTAQAMRSVRVIIDIGMHLGLKIPSDSDFHPGETWTPELGLEFLLARSRFPADFMRSEVDRYLGLPGQAISYKVGERVWLESRAAAKSAGGPRFNLKSWHNRALSIGPLGLDRLRQELATPA
ncbi:MAG: DUF885 domain-containing protein [SAR202 cluster bacterium]|nr:DUF885 domain-containing protein [SAR202 cluster bacterium]